MSWMDLSVESNVADKIEGLVGTDRALAARFIATLQDLKEGNILLPLRVTDWEVRVEGTGYVLIVDVDTDRVTRVKDIAVKYIR